MKKLPQAFIDRATRAMEQLGFSPTEADIDLTREFLEGRGDRPFTRDSLDAYIALRMDIVTHECLAALLKNGWLEARYIGPTDPKTEASSRIDHHLYAFSTTSLFEGAFSGDPKRQKA